MIDDRWVKGHLILHSTDLVYPVRFHEVQVKFQFLGLKEKRLCVKSITGLIEKSTKVRLINGNTI